MNTAISRKTQEELLPVASRYFLAKYIPDLLRYEPRNIGVILWTPHGTTARFIGESKSGNLDSRTLPSFVGDSSVYREWVINWRNLIQADGLKNILGPLEALDFDSEPKVRAALANNASKAHWVLVPGGVVLDPVLPGEEHGLINRLYDQLIGEHLPASVESEVIDKIVRSLVKAMGMKKNPHFRPDFEYKSKNEHYSFRIDYAFVGKEIHRVWQMLPTMPQKRQGETYAEATAYKLQTLHNERGLHADQMKVLVNMNDDQWKRHKSSITMVGRHAQVLNMFDTNDRAAAFADLPKLGAEEGTPLFS